MKELTKEKAVELHRKLWDEIYMFLLNNKANRNNSFEELKKIKSECLKKILNDMDDEAYDYGLIVYAPGMCSLPMIHVSNYCFLCEYKMRLYNGYDYIQLLNCEDVCPLFDPNNKRGGCLNGLYEEFCNAFYEEFCNAFHIKDYRNCLDIAARIRDLPVVN